MQFYSVALSGLLASQYAIDQTANNIANANTPGFHRREILMANRKELQFNGRFLGGGSMVKLVRGVREQVIEHSLSQATGDLSAIDQRLHYENQIESLFVNRSGSLNERFNNLFGEIGKLSTNPSQASQRNVVVNQGTQLANQFKFMSGQLNSLKARAKSQIQQEVRDLNQKIKDLVEIQQRLRLNTSSQPQNDLIDQRDVLLNEIAEIIDVNRSEIVQDGYGVLLGGGALSIGDSPLTIHLETDSSGAVQLQIGDEGRSFVPRAGRLAALLETHNTTVPLYQDRLTELAGNLMRQFDQTQAQGIGTSGSFQQLSSTRRVSDVSVPLAQANLAFPPASGELFINVVDAAGERRTERLSLDPQTDSLNDLATRINGLDNLQAIVDGTTGKLTVFAAAGYQFDFTGRLETIPDRTAFSGTSVPRWSGSYSGSDNQDVRVVINGSGTIGVTPGLQAEVYDANNSLLRVVEIGQGYEAGTAVEIVSGAKLEFGPGTVAAADEFSTPLVANSDSGQLLSALGLNSFFSGSHALDMEVQSALLSDSGRIATGFSGEVGDTANLKKFMALRDQPLVDGKHTFEEFLAETTSLIGGSVRAGNYLQSQLQDLKADYEQQREAVSGVDVNEEMINLSKFQRAFEATVRTLTTMDQMYEDLLAVVR